MTAFHLFPRALTVLLTLWLGTLVFSFSGCQKTGAFLDVPNSDYHSVLDDVTREKRFISLAEAKYMAHVTYKNETWRKAYVEEYAKKFDLTPVEKEELLTKELAEAQKYDVFLFSLYTGDNKASDLSKSSSVWKTWLEREGEEGRVDAEMITKLSDREPNLRYFYPYVTSGWSNVYEMKFPRQAQASQVSLRAAGVLGNLTFVWTNPN